MAMEYPLPDGWKWVFLEDCVEVLDYRRKPVNADERQQRILGKAESELFPYYGATGRVGWIDDFIFDEEILLLGEDGAPFLDPGRDKAYLVKEKCWVNNHAHVLKARNGITTNSFLLHYLNRFDYQDYVTGTTRLKLNQSRMLKIPVVFPPLDEQERIVAKIEELFTQLDAGTASLRGVQARLKRYKASVLKAAVEGRLVPQDPSCEPAAELLRRLGKSPVAGDDLPELPDGWCWTHLHEIGELARGKSKYRPRNASFLYGGPYPFIQTGDIRQSQGTITTYSQTYSEAGLKQSRLWKKGTLCITIAANIAETGILQFDACFPDSVVGFVASEGIETRFVQYFINTAKGNLERFAPATAQKNINLNILQKLVVPLPPTKEQQRIVAEVEQRLSVAAEVEKAVEAALARAARLRQSILKRAFEGKLLRPAAAQVETTAASFSSGEAA